MNKQETLEEFSRRRFNEQKLDTNTSYNIEDAIKEGAKWQQKQDKNLYSEEDLLKFGSSKLSAIFSATSSSVSCLFIFF